MAYQNNEQKDEIIVVDPKTLKRNIFQVRELDENDTRVVNKAESIKKNGLIEYPIVRRVGEDYQIATGHIRTLACIKLGMPTIKCILRPFSDEQMAVAVLEENLKHETLNPIEEGVGYRNMRDHFHWTEAQTAEKFGTTRDRVAQRLRLTTFQPGLRQLIAEGRISVSHAEAVNTAPVTEQMGLAQRVMEEGLTVMQATDRAKELRYAEVLNRATIHDIGSIVTRVNFRLNQVEIKASDIEKSMCLVQFHGTVHQWKSRDCKYNVDNWCHGFSWGEEPTFWGQRLAGVASFKKLEDNKWHIQANGSVCSLCHLYQPRPSNSSPGGK